MHLLLPKWFPLFILASFICWSLQCLISALIQGARWWSLFSGSLVESCFGEGGTLQTNITGVCSQGFSHTGFAPTHSLCAFPVYTTQTLGCSAGNCLMWALVCMHFPGLSRSGSGSQVLHKGADLVGPVSASDPGLSSSGDQVLGVCSHPQLKAVTYPLPRPSRSIFWVCNGRAFSGVPCVSSGKLIWLRPSRLMSTVQNPKKSWLAMTSACSLV